MRPDEVLPTPAPVPEGLDLDELAAVALETATRCARLVLEERPRDLGVAATKSSATDVVTAMDTASERLARSIVADRRPGDGFHGEESEAVPARTPVTWVVDPIDGTVNYLYDNPGYCVSVAAVVGDPGRPGGYRPVAAAVLGPRYREAFVAAAGRGARLLTLDDRLEPVDEPRELRVDAPTDLGETLLATGFAYRARTRTWQGAIVAGLLPRVRDIRRGGSAALDLCWVAAGRHDAYAESGLHPWDLAGGWLVVTEAGGRVCDLDGSAPGETWTIAGGAAAVTSLRSAISELGGRQVPAAPAPEHPAPSVAPGPRDTPDDLGAAH